MLGNQRKESKEEWTAKDLNECVLKGGDPECTLLVGEPQHKRFWVDLTIVRIEKTVSVSQIFSYSIFSQSWQPYFCGQDEGCDVLGSHWALQRAKENVEQWFF